MPHVQLIHGHYWDVHWGLMQQVQYSIAGHHDEKVARVFHYFAKSIDYLWRLEIHHKCCGTKTQFGKLWCPKQRHLVSCSWCHLCKSSVLLSWVNTEKNNITQNLNNKCECRNLLKNNCLKIKAVQRTSKLHIDCISWPSTHSGSKEYAKNRPTLDLQETSKCPEVYQQQDQLHCKYMSLILLCYSHKTMWLCKLTKTTSPSIAD